MLGVATAASAGEIRRAYRHLALRFHPDRAGPDATAQFQQIAAAYRVLSDGPARARYDAIRAQTSAAARPAMTTEHTNGGHPGDPDFAGPYRERRHVTFGGSSSGPDVIARISGSLEDLLAQAVARRQADGSLDLLLTKAEGRRGGMAAITLPCRVPCTTCGGVAEKNRVWCARCEFAGTVVEEVTVCVRIPAHVADGTGFRVAIDPMNDTPALRVRIKYDHQRG